jgi:hypothetical protein
VLESLVGAILETCERAFAGDRLTHTLNCLVQIRVELLGLAPEKDRLNIRCLS